MTAPRVGRFNIGTNASCMADKSNKLRARLPRGLADRGPAEMVTRPMMQG